MLVLERSSATPLYEQIYQYIKARIEAGQYEAGTRLPSVRSLAGEIGVSKITVEQAYLQLAAEGYIKAHDRSPYEVLALPLTGETIFAGVSGVDSLFQKSRAVKLDESVTAETGMGKALSPSAGPDSLMASNVAVKPVIEYNFATGAMDPEGFDYTRWKRYIGYVLREPERLLAYGDPQGELELRLQLAQYLNTARAVRTTAEQIIIGSGTQAMVMMIAALLKRAHITTVAIDHSALIGVTHIFKDYGFTVVTIDQHSESLIADLMSANVQALYCTPSHGDRQGRVMSVGRRKELLQWSKAVGSYLIEDDYDSELRYYGRPISSLQGLAREEHVIYLGTPSKVLPPSIRISYMVLPPSLWNDFLMYRSSYRQSASVMEQLVWARYMAAGEWSKQIRRLRKHYADKSKQLVSQLQLAFGDQVKAYLPEGGVYIGLSVYTLLGADDLLAKARQAGCDVRIEADIAAEGEVHCLLSFSAIPTAKLHAAVTRLAAAWKGV